MRRDRRFALVVSIALAALIPACRDRAAEPTGRPEGWPTPLATGAVTSKLTDLGGSLDVIRADFNAHKGEKRFLTLLAPT